MADIEKKRKNWLDNLPSEEEIYDTKEKNDLARAIQKHQEAKGKVTRIDGVYGDWRGGDAYVEAVIVSPKGGKFTKLYGCSYLLKGYPYSEIIDRVATVKRVAMEAVRLLGKYPLRLMFGKKWRKDVADCFIMVYMADLEKHQLPLNEFQISTRELIRVGLKFFPEKLVYCFAMFYEFDNAYRQRIQDILSNLNQEALESHPIREINRLFNLAISREKESIIWKIELFKKLIVAILIISPKTKRLVKDFLLDLDLEKISPDESDRYFTLNRRGYNFQGRTFEDRKVEWDKINKEKGHIILGWQN